ncbi:MAG: type I-E CRISPR-associated protein Cse2/CasB [Opitutales bacterium]
MKSIEQIESEATEFINFLNSVKDNNAIIADLRSAMNENLSFKSFKHLAKYGGISKEGEYRYKANVVRLIAYMFALSKGNYVNNSRNFGSVAMDTFKADGTKIADIIKDKDARFLKVISSDKYEIIERIRSFSSLINAKGVKVDYVKLYKDLILWSPHTREIWAESFYNYSKEVKEEGVEQND